MRNFKKSVEHRKIAELVEAFDTSDNPKRHQLCSPPVPGEHDDKRVQEELNLLQEKILISNGLVKSSCYQSSCSHSASGIMPFEAEFPVFANSRSRQMQEEIDFDTQVNMFLALFRSTNAQEEWAHLFVDMHDDEIRNMWASTSMQLESQTSFPMSNQNMCLEPLPSMPPAKVQSSAPTLCIEIKPGLTGNVFKDYARPTSFITGGTWNF